LKAHSETDPANQNMWGMDMAFILLLLAVAVSGLALLALRETSAMGVLLAVHLGFILALFATLPYSKFVHAVYRLGALLRHESEKAGGKRP
jgi:citrate/tricarballylate utilization protein